LGIATEDDVDSWLKDIELVSIEKPGPGIWNFVQKSGDSTINGSIMYIEGESSLPPTIGVGCLFLDPPEKNQLELFKRLLELHAISQETKFSLLKDGSIMLITHRSAVDLDPSELKEMISTVVSMYERFHDDCLSIVS
jgi:hypothetical protein